MARVPIENPIINSPFEEPRRHYKFSAEGITEEIVTGRRRSEYFVPVARPKKQVGQLTFGHEFVPDRVEPNEFINRLRRRVSVWRLGGYQGVTSTTRFLLDYWTNPAREKKLFFCQIEALETVIYITEVAHKYGENWIANDLRQANEAMNPELFRLAFKMATGSGKTVVMAMLIAWHALNKFANRQDARFADSFLLVAPGITIRDRLQVLLPGNPDNYYRQRDIVPPDLMTRLGQARIAIINFHAMLLKEKLPAGKLTKEILARGQGVSAFTETPDEMARRVCRDLGNKKSIIVINDEAHHCYRPREDTEKLTGEERQEAEKLAEEARVWLSGLEAIQRKVGVKVVYDLSATPFYLKGSGYPEGKIFPWVVSDFSLIDAIESGIVKIPRVPVMDNSMAGTMPTYRDLWVQVRDHLPKKGRKQTGVDQANAAPKLPSKSVMMGLDDLKRRRVQEVDFLLAKLVLETYFRTDSKNLTGLEDLSGLSRPARHTFEAEVQAWRFPEILPIVRQWRESCLHCKDDTFPQLLLMLDFAYTAADRIYQAIQLGQTHFKKLKPILQPYETTGSTTHVDFDTTRPTYQTTKSHVSHVALDSTYDEAKLANNLELMPEVISYVKNDGLGLTIPYTLGIKERSYVPDYLVRIDDGQPDPLNLIIEVTGEKKSDKAAKVATAQNMWIPAINNHGGFGRWAFIELDDPDNAKTTLREALKHGFETKPLLLAVEENSNE